MEQPKQPEPLILSAEKNKAAARWQGRRRSTKWRVVLIEEEKIQVATLLHRFGIECVEVYFNFKRDNEGDQEEIPAVEKKFEALYCSNPPAVYYAP